MVVVARTYLVGRGGAAAAAVGEEGTKVQPQCFRVQFAKSMGERLRCSRLIESASAAGPGKGLIWLQS